MHSVAINDAKVIHKFFENNYETSRGVSIPYALRSKLLCKVVIIGMGMSGKDILAKCFTGDSTFNDNDITVGANYASRFWESDGRKVTTYAQVSVLNGFHWPGLLKSPCPKADGIIITYDITNWSDFCLIESWFFPTLKELGYTNDNTAVMLVGTKMDLEHKRKVKTELGKDVADKHSCMFMETSARDNINVEKAFDRVIRKAHEIKKEE